MSEHSYLMTLKMALAVGDLIGCGISHPCTAFDKWRLLPLINADRTIVGAVHTYF